MAAQVQMEMLRVLESIRVILLAIYEEVRGEGSQPWEEREKK